jgi:arginine decarboxylase
MNIKVTYGKGEGLTKLSAFDKALYDAGIANYNLITLSSVIPKNSEVVIEKVDFNQKEHGYKLYVVLSKCVETTIGKEAWAGLGWVTQDNNTGKGLFVEHSGSSEEEVKELINNSLESMKEYRPEEHGKINIQTVGIKCKDKPVCSVVAAVYKSENWEN